MPWKNVGWRDVSGAKLSAVVFAELKAVELANELTAIAESGVYGRNWQHCLVLLVKFRIELSILRVEYACGANTAVSVRARQQQRTGLDHVDALPAQPLEAQAPPAVRACRWRNGCNLDVADLPAIRACKYYCRGDLQPAAPERASLRDAAGYCRLKAVA